MPNVDFQLVDVVGSVAAVNAIQRREADVGDVRRRRHEAQVHLVDHPEPSVGALRGMAALRSPWVHLVARLMHTSPMHFGLVATVSAPVRNRPDRSASPS
jgi:hypothetical protein